MAQMKMRDDESIARYLKSGYVSDVKIMFECEFDYMRSLTQNEIDAIGDNGKKEFAQSCVKFFNSNFTPRKDLSNLSVISTLYGGISSANISIF